MRKIMIISILVAFACSEPNREHAPLPSVAYKDFRIDQDGGGLLGDADVHILVGFFEEPYLRGDGVMDFGLTALLAIDNRGHRDEIEVRLGTRIVVAGVAYHCVEIAPDRPSPPEVQTEKGGKGYVVMRRWSDSR